MPADRVAVRLPRPRNGVGDASVHGWLVAVEARAKARRLVVSVESDKATVELEGPVTGSRVTTVAEAGGRDHGRRCAGRVRPGVTWV